MNSIKQFVILVLVLSLYSCEEKGKSIVEETNESSTSLAESKKQDIDEQIPLLSFAELESSYIKDIPEGRTYVLNFWATWCKPCVKELPYFEELNKNYKDKNVEVVLVSLDFPEKIESQVIPFITKHQLNSEIVLLDDPDANAWIPMVSKDWSGAIPATLIINNKRSEFYENSFTYEELEQALKKIL